MPPYGTGTADIPPGQRRSFMLASRVWAERVAVGIGC
jgi:hypothetical protein